MTPTLKPVEVVEAASGDAFAGPDSPLRGGPAIETFRALALSVEHLMNMSSPWSVAVISPFPDRGRRRIIAELLARGLSEIRPPVRLVEADPEVGAWPAAVADVREPPDTSPFGKIRLGGRLACSPQALVEEVRRTIAVEADRGGSLVIDTPPATGSSLAFSLAQLANATIYVARTAASTSPVHAQVRDQLELLGVWVLGIVVDEV